MQLSFSKINQSVYEVIKDKIGSSYGSGLVKNFSEYYFETEKKIIHNILQSPFIHADETTISILGEIQYVCVDFYNK